ncbi:MAG: DUF4097 family beta strand repeat protein [Xanthomonadales bacterium]|nr:DUF4097 family beta strand repeat protein [Xanthomonadales bacterium]
MNILSIAAASLVLLATLPLPLAADTPIDERRPASATVQLRVENVAGRVEVVVGADDQLVVTGDLGEGSKPLRIEGGPERMSVRVEPEEGGGWRQRMAPSRLRLEVPARTRLEVSTVSADISVDGVSGERLELESVSGRIIFAGAPGRATLKTVSGAIDGRGDAPQWTVGTVSGAIALDGVGGELRVDSVSGAISLSAGAVSRVRAETVSGRIRARVPLTGAATVAMQSVSGAIELRLPVPVDARIQASTFSGPVASDFGTPERGGVGGGRRLDVREGTGRAEVRLESFSGSVTILRDQ